MLCHRCSARLPRNAPVCCNCGALDPKPKRSLFRPSMMGLAAGLMILVLAAGTRFGRATEAPVVANGTPPAAAPAAVTPVRVPIQPAPAASTAEPVAPVATQRRWTSTWVNVRDGRGTETAVVRTLDPGVAIDVHDRRGHWWAVVDRGNHVGYVANSVLLQEPPVTVSPDPAGPLATSRTRR